MKIVIASDHAGVEYKQKIIQHINSIKGKVTEVIDLGPVESKTSVDYPDYAVLVCQKVQADSNIKGILICGTGVGMSITANKFKGIRASLCTDTFSARMTRMHNDANVLCLGARVTGEGLALDIVDIWINTEFEAGRHLNRLNKICKIEKGE
jgi:ribose 5-phosphate isomerase B